MLATSFVGLRLAATRPTCNLNAKLRFNPKDEWVVCKVHHKNGEANKKPAKEEYSAGTPNVSSVISDDAGEGDDFLDSMMNPMFFNSAGNLPASTTTVSAAAPPDNADYAISSSTAAGATTGTTSSFVNNLPSYYYGFNDDTASINNQVALANSAAAPRSSGYIISSWTTNMLHADHHNQAMERSYNLHQQAMVAKALGGNHFAGGLPGSSVASVGILQQSANSMGMPQQRIGNYGEFYANHLTK